MVWMSSRRVLNIFCRMMIHRTRTGCGQPCNGALNIDNAFRPRGRATNFQIEPPPRTRPGRRVHAHSPSFRDDALYASLRILRAQMETTHFGAFQVALRYGDFGFFTSPTAFYFFGTKGYQIFMTYSYVVYCCALPRLYLDFILPLVQDTAAHA